MRELVSSQKSWKTFTMFLSSRTDFKPSLKGFIFVKSKIKHLPSNPIYGRDMIWWCIGSYLDQRKTLAPLNSLTVNPKDKNTFLLVLDVTRFHNLWLVLTLLFCHCNLLFSNWRPLLLGEAIQLHQPRRALRSLSSLSCILSCTYSVWGFSYCLMNGLREDLVLLIGLYQKGRWRLYLAATLRPRFNSSSSSSSIQLKLLESLRRIYELFAHLN